jgi:hypothetical protein
MGKLVKFRISTAVVEGLFCSVEARGRREPTFLSYEPQLISYPNFRKSFLQHGK